ncbi:MAG: hypothetical protein GX802_08000 [Clostridiales bacterium]|nr:hypothetical protein [Clostridiales bacterium]
MNDIQEKTRKQFCEWLTKKAPKAQLDSVCRSLSVAEVFCLKTKVLSTPLFETTDVATVKRFAKTVRQNKIFRIKNKKQINSIVSAADWYYAFVRALPAIQHTENNIEKASVTIAEAENLAVVDFDDLQSLAFTKPVALIYCGYRDESISNWADLYVKLVSRLYNDYSSSIPVGKSFTGSGRIDFGNKEIAREMTAPKPIYMQMYLETNLSATNTVSKVKALLDICNVDYREVVIEYQKKESPDMPSSDTAMQQGSIPISTISFSDWLRNIEKMADGTCRSYVSSLNKAEEYAQEHNLSSQRIVGVDSDEALTTIACLMANEGFRQVNQDQHDRFSAAFQKLEKYCRYLSSDGTRSIDVGAIDSPRRVKTSSVSQSNSALNELAESLYTFLKESSDGISKDDILAHFNNYSTQQVNRALVECHAVKVLKNYYHKDNISDFDEMADILLDVLLKQFAANGDYTSAQQLYNDAHFRLDDFFFYNNAFESRPEVFDLAVHLFTQENYKGNSFLFLNGMHIWKNEPNYPKDFHGLLIKYGREHQNIFTRKQALTFFESIGSTTPDQSFSNILFTSGSKSFLQYAENCFVLNEALHVNDNFLSALRIQIENLLEGEDYIAFGEIDDYFYTTLPAIPANIQWSPLLLEDVLRIFDIGYITIEAGSDNDKKTIPAAILKKKSQFRTFSDIVWNEVSKTYSLPEELTASEFREFLLDKGFIHGSEKMWNVHKTVAGDLRFYWTEKNSKVTIN